MRSSDYFQGSCTSVDYHVLALNIVIWTAKSSKDSTSNMSLGHEDLGESSIPFGVGPVGDIECMRERRLVVRRFSKRRFPRRMVDYRLTCRFNSRLNGKEMTPDEFKKRRFIMTVESVYYHRNPDDRMSMSYGAQHSCCQEKRDWVTFFC